MRHLLLAPAAEIPTNITAYVTAGESAVDAFKDGAEDRAYDGSQDSSRAPQDRSLRMISSSMSIRSSSQVVWPEQGLQKRYAMLLLGEEWA